MKTVIEMHLTEENLSFAIEQYGEEGIEFISSKPGNIKGTVVATFSGDIDTISRTSNENNKTYIEFEDGCRSPLYIKRERNFWED